MATSQRRLKRHGQSEKKTLKSFDGLQLSMPAIPDEEILQSDIAILPGSHDVYGVDVIILPPSSTDRLMNHFTPAHLVILLQYYVTLAKDLQKQRSEGITKSNSYQTSSLPALDGGAKYSRSVRRVQSGAGVAVLADLSSYTKEGLHKLIDALDRVEQENPGSICNLYCIQPKHKQLRKTLKKLTGLKRTKRYHRITTFNTMLFDDLKEVQSVIRREQLIEEFKGTLTYNHSTCLEYIKMLCDVEKTVKRILYKIPPAIDHMSMTLEYDVNQSNDDDVMLKLVQSQAMQIRNKYNNIMRDINIEHIIDECQQLLIKVSDAKSNVPYNEIIHSPVLKYSIHLLKHYRQILLAAREKLNHLWRKSERQTIHTAKILKYKTKANKVLHWLSAVGFPLIQQTTTIASSVGEAEMLKNHYETGFYAIAKKVLCLSESIQHKLDHTITAGQLTTDSANLIAFCRNFEAKLEFFRHGCETKRQLYASIYKYFTTSEKVLNWYHKTLKFLPVQLLTLKSDGRLFDVPEAWHSAIEDYLFTNPAPKIEQLKTLQDIIPKLEDVHLRNKTRLLLSRLFTVRQILFEPDKLEAETMQDIFGWQQQVIKGQDDTLLFLKKVDTELTHAQLNLKTRNDSEKKTGTESKYISVQNTDDIINQDNSIGKLSDSITSEEGMHYSEASKDQVNHSLSSTDDGDYLQPQLSVNPLNQRSPLPSSKRRPRMSDFTSSGHYRGPRNSKNTIYSVDEHKQCLSSKERYVSLGADGMNSVYPLPPTLSHVDINALQNNGPQKHLERQSSSGVDSALGSMQDYRNIFQSKGIRRTSRRKDFAAIDLDHIATSSLLPEQKINLMAAFCAEDFEGQEETLTILQLSHEDLLDKEPELDFTDDSLPPDRDSLVQNELTASFQELTLNSMYSHKVRQSSSLNIPKISLRNSITSESLKAHNDVDSLYKIGRTQQSSIRSTGSGIDIQAWVDEQEVAKVSSKPYVDTDYTSNKSTETNLEISNARRKRMAEEATLLGVEKDMKDVFSDEEDQTNEMIDEKIAGLLYSQEDNVLSIVSGESGMYTQSTQQSQYINDQPSEVQQSSLSKAAHCRNHTWKTKL